MEGLVFVALEIYFKFVIWKWGTLSNLFSFCCLVCLLLLLYLDQYQPSSRAMLMYKLIFENRAEHRWSSLCTSEFLNIFTLAWLFLGDSFLVTSNSFCVTTKGPYTHRKSHDLIKYSCVFTSTPSNMYCCWFHEAGFEFIRDCFSSCGVLTLAWFL